jgi:16S rRNA (cytosine967-C5)-methyltransferase
MNPRIAANQQRTFLAQLATVLPHVRTDSGLPRRIKDLLGRNRAFGSRDRRLYRELIYTAIRFLPWIETLLAHDENLAAQVVAWLAPEMKDTSAYRAALLDGWPSTPPTLTEKAAVLRARFASDAAAFDPAALLPAWFRDHCPAAFAAAQLDALLSRAPIWIRLQVNDRAMVLDEFRRKSWEPRATAVSPDAFALPPNAEVANTDAYRRGFVEIQDLGSQLVLAHAPVAASERWLDACAGAGGKTLQLAHAVGASGRVDATDIRPAMLEELRERATRARLTNVRITTLASSPPAASARAETRNSNDGAYDGVLVDAPCSGSGTWRRLPHMKWHTQPETIPQFAAQQLAILSANAAQVRPGGLLVYATCSLSHVENHDVAAAFLATHAEFSAEKPTRDLGGHFDGAGTSLLPATHDSDGFYVSLLRRR